MKRYAILRNYREKSPANKILFGRDLEEHQTDNPHLPTPSPTPAQINTATNALEQAALAAAGGDSTALHTLKLREEEWDTVIDNSADYVEDEAKGNSEIMLSAGFAVTKVTFDKHTKPEKVVVKVVSKDGEHGALDVGTKTITNSEGMIAVAVFLDGDVPFSVQKAGDRQFNFMIGNHRITFLAMTRHHGLMVGLPPQKVPLVYMAGFNAAGAGPISDVVSDVVVP
jgi:hypothetical protein